MVILHWARLVLGWATHQCVEKPGTAKLSNTSSILCGTLPNLPLPMGVYRSARAGPEIKSSKRARLRGLRAGLQAKLYTKFAYKTSNYEKVIYALMHVLYLITVVRE